MFSKTGQESGYHAKSVKELLLRVEYLAPQKVIGKKLEVIQIKEILQPIYHKACETSPDQRG